MVNVEQTGRTANVTMKDAGHVKDSTNTGTPTKQKLIQIKARISAGRAFYFLDTFACSEINSHKDGSITAIFSAPDEAWLCGMLLSFGPDMKIISPKGIKDKVLQMAKCVTELYKK